MMTSSYLAYIFKDPISKYGYNHWNQSLGLQHIFLGDTIKRITDFGLEGCLGPALATSIPCCHLREQEFMDSYCSIPLLTCFSFFIFVFLKFLL